MSGIFTAQVSRAATFAIAESLDDLAVSGERHPGVRIDALKLIRSSLDDDGDHLVPPLRRAVAERPGATCPLPSMSACAGVLACVLAEGLYRPQSRRARACCCCRADDARVD